MLLSTNFIMRLTKYSDFALRTLMYVAMAKRRCTIDEIAERTQVSTRTVNRALKSARQLAMELVNQDEQKR